MYRLRRDAHREFVAEPIQLPLLRLPYPNIASATIGNQGGGDAGDTGAQERQLNVPEHEFAYQLDGEATGVP